MEIIKDIKKSIIETNDETCFRLSIFTTKIHSNKNWKAYIQIHIPKVSDKKTILQAPYLYQIILDEKDIYETDFKTLIGKQIISKKYIELNEHTEGTPKYTKTHMTKLSFTLDDGKVLHFRIGEVYDSYLDNYYIHTGGDNYY